MKLSKETISILKNFKTITLGIIFRPGNILRTISPRDTILAEAKVAEDFPSEFAVADLGKFISVQELFTETPDLKFNDTNLTISLDNTKLTYVYASKEVVKSYDKTLEFPESLIKFDLSKDEMISLLKTAYVLGTSNFVVRVAAGKVSVSVEDVRDVSAGKFAVEVKEAERSQSGMLVVRIENLTILEGDYTIEFVSKGGNYIGVFTNKTIPVKYFVSLEDSSKIEN